MRRHLPAALLASALLAGAAVGLASRFAPPRVSSEGPVWRYREGNLLYRFHATFREERLFDGARDPYETRDLSAERPGDLARLRGAFLRRIAAPGLDRVPAPGESWRNDAAGLGYR